MWKVILFLNKALRDDKKWNVHYTEFSNKGEKKPSLLGRIGIFMWSATHGKFNKGSEYSFRCMQAYIHEHLQNSAIQHRKVLWNYSFCYRVGEILFTNCFPCCNLCSPVCPILEKKEDVLKSSRMKIFSVLFHILIPQHLLSD